MSHAGESNQPAPPTFQQLIQRLNTFWADQGCVLVQSLDLEVGAGTFHPATFLRSLGPEPLSGILRGFLSKPAQVKV